MKDFYRMVRPSLYVCRLHKLYSKFFRWCSQLRSYDSTVNRYSSGDASVTMVNAMLILLGEVQHIFRNQDTDPWYRAAKVARHLFPKHTHARAKFTENPTVNGKYKYARIEWWKLGKGQAGMRTSSNLA
jgi:hypothetical protein